MRTFTTKGVLGLALLCLVLTIASSQMSPQPGSMMISTNLKYLNNIFGLVFPITMQQLLQKQTFNLDFYQGGISYQFDFMQVTHNEKKALESRMIDEDGEKLLKFYNILTAYYEKYLAKFDFSKIVVK